MTDDTNEHDDNNPEQSISFFPEGGDTASFWASLLNMPEAYKYTTQIGTPSITHTGFINSQTVTLTQGESMEFSVAKARQVCSDNALFDFGRDDIFYELDSSGYPVWRSWSDGYHRCGTVVAFNNDRNHPHSNVLVNCISGMKFPKDFKMYSDADLTRLRKQDGTKVRRIKRTRLRLEVTEQGTPVIRSWRCGYMCGNVPVPTGSIQDAENLLTLT